ncbi:hypothetical protein [Paracoccus beibuensis]|uniref:hypothetical protein n=1 Tax=Paracoccus beibuensis TaxID=547602 RepID=UPI0022408567|nr:hypothetical protein [Paracoccus beibuensis]
MPHPYLHVRRDPVLLFALSCALALAWVLAAVVLGWGPDRLFSESGPVERLSALYLVLAGMWLAADQLWQGRWPRWHLVVLILAAALRELDWDKAFTDRGILSSGLYSGPHPLGQKLVGSLVLAVLIWAGVRMLRRDLGPWLAGLRNGQGGLLGLALPLYVVAKSLDGLGRKLAPWGIEISGRLNDLAGRTEEVLELFGSLLILQSVCVMLLRPARGEDLGAVRHAPSPQPNAAQTEAHPPRQQEAAE